MSKKKCAEVCPYCGSEYTEVEERITDLGVDDNQQEHLYLFEARTCTECHKSFTDSYIIEYDGYIAEAREYDRNGKLVIDWQNEIMGVSK